MTAGYMCDAPRRELYRHMDAANVDLKAFTEGFYRKLCTGALQPVLDTLVYLKRETSVWFEVTTLLIPGQNDSPAEIARLCTWFAEHLGPDVPLHFTAFHPDWKMMDVPPTLPATLIRAREVATAAGLRYVYTGNIHDEATQSTWCHACGGRLIGRDWYEITAWNLTREGECEACGTRCAGVFGGAPGAWGRKRRPLFLGDLSARL